MNPVDRIARHLSLAGIQRDVQVTVKREGEASYVKTVDLTDDERAAAYAAAAERAIALNEQVEQARDLTIATAKVAVARAIATGEFLLEMSQLFSGRFTEWLEGYCGDHISRATAYNYMKAVRYKQALGDDCPDFATLKDLFIAAGIMPPPTPGESNPGSTAPVFRLSLSVNGPPPEQWEPVVRRDFIQRAKPIVDLYERAKAAEQDG